MHLGVAVAVRIPRERDAATPAATPVSCISDSFGAVAWPLDLDPAACAPERVDFTARDTCEKEVVYVDRGLSCRIDSVVSWDEYPEFVPLDDDLDEEPAAADDTPPAVPDKDETGTICIALRADSTRRCSTPLAISRASMRQGWEDTPPVRINLARLGRLSLPAQQSPRERPGTGSPAGTPPTPAGFFRFANWSQVSVTSSQRSGSPVPRFYGAKTKGLSQLSLTTTATPSSPPRTPPQRKAPRPVFVPQPYASTERRSDKSSRKSPDIGRPSRFTWRLWRF